MKQTESAEMSEMRQLGRKSDSRRTAFSVTKAIGDGDCRKTNINFKIKIPTDEEVSKKRHEKSNWPFWFHNFKVRKQNDHR